MLEVPPAQALGGGTGAGEGGGVKVYHYASLKQRGQRERKAVYELGLMLKAAPPPFHRTSLVTLLPRYVLVSKLAQPLEYSQAG